SSYGDWSSDVCSSDLPETWQHYRRGFKNYTELDTIDGSSPARRTATRDGGPCVFLNDAGFAGGWGCALHAQALRDGVHPLEYKRSEERRVGNGGGLGW